MSSKVYRPLIQIVFLLYVSVLALASFQYLSLYPRLKEFSRFFQGGLNHLSIAPGLSLFDMEDPTLPFFFSDCIIIFDHERNELFKSNVSCEGHSHRTFIPPREMLVRRTLVEARDLAMIGLKKNLFSLLSLSDHYLMSLMTYYCSKIESSEKSEVILTWHNQLDHRKALSTPERQETLVVRYSCSQKKFLTKRWILI